MSPTRTSRSIRRHLILGIATVILLVGGVGGWASTTEFAGAVIAPGLLVVENSSKKVQHPVGGVIGEIRVAEGDRVEAGQVVFRLDETQTRANLAIVTKQLDELAAIQARLEAERDGTDEVSFPPAIATRGSEPDIAALISGERSLFVARQQSRSGQKAQLVEQVAQLKQQINGYMEQAAATKSELFVIAEELSGKQALFDKQLTTLQQITPLQRDKARLEGEHGSLVANIARAKGLVAEVELKIIQIEHDFRTEAGRELAEIRAKVSELHERRVAAEDELNRVDIRAPHTGIVHELGVHTIGGVIGPGEVLMYIIPESDELVIEARIPPEEIDQLHIGQEAMVRFSAFNQRTTPEVQGTVARISPDLTMDSRTGHTYYTVRIRVAEEEVARLGQRLVAGMPVEAFIRTGERTVLTYLTKPLTDQMDRAFREE